MTTKHNESSGDVRIFNSTCAYDCGADSNCLLKLHVKDGVIIRIETDDGEEPQLRACARGRAQRKRVYSPDRLKYPMKRVGERGEGKFERISWEEALDKIASEMKRIKAAYGPGAFVNTQYAGEFGLQGPAVGRLMNMFGGNLSWWGGASLEGNYYAVQATFGNRLAAQGFPNSSNSRLVIMWGWNPANNFYRGNINLPYLFQAKEKGARFVCVDPRYTMSAAIFADEWIPIIPGTDTAMLIAMAYVMITENLCDQKFLDTYTLGFDKYKEYVLGKEDGIAKTPAWAEAITGVPAATIASLAREYATTKPATLEIGWGPSRTSLGEQYSRAANVLRVMAGNVGTPWSDNTQIEGVPRRRGFGKGRNPFDYEPDTASSRTAASGKGYESFDYSQSSRMGSALDPVIKNRRRVLQGKLYDAILEGKSGGYPSDVKMVWVNCANTLNQIPNTNKGVRAFKKLDFLVVSELVMTPTAKFADILLPVKSHFERDNIYGGGFALYFCRQAISPMFECRSDFEICCDLAKRLGIENYSDKTEAEWWRWEMSGEETKKYIPDFEEFRKQGLYKPPPTDEELPWAFKRQIEDPKNNPFSTPSGKIEIYSQGLADLHNSRIPPIPKYIETWEGRTDPLARNYPLQLISTHYKMRAHSNFGNVPWLSQIEPQRVTINTADAESRGIRDGDLVRVFNDRGTIIIPAFVTATIMPGVVNISEGGWFIPDKDGIDRGGCPNVLTGSEHSPGGAWCTNTSLVQAAKA